MTLFDLFKRYRFKIFLAFLCVVLANLLALALPWFLKVLLDEVLLHKNTPLAHVLYFLVATIVLKAFFEYVGSYLGLEVAEKAVADLRKKVFRHLLDLSVLDIENFSTGELISRVLADTESVKRFLFNGVLDLFYSALSAVFVVGILFCMNTRLALIATLVVPLFLVVYGRMAGKLKQGYGSIRQCQAELSGRLGEVFRGIRTVHMFGQREEELSRFSAAQERILHIALKNHSGDTWFFVTAEFLTSLGLIALLGYGVRQIAQGTMTVGTLVAFYAYFGLLFLPLLKITASGGVYREARVSWERICELLRHFPAKKETEHPRVVKKIRGNVRFQNVAFTYPGSRGGLSGVELEVKSGEWVAFVGPNGSGKTTLACLLGRFFEPGSGRVVVDGVDIRSLSLEYYRSQVTVIGQNELLFLDTLAGNIRYGCPEADETKVLAAAKSADIHSFISGLPQGYNTCVGEAGLRLSGGQRQRVVLARALLRDPAILVLDEALSAIDPESLSGIMRTMRQIRKDRTTLIITHRLLAAEYVDKIVVMKKGKIEEISQPHAVRLV